MRASKSIEDPMRYVTFLLHRSHAAFEAAGTQRWVMASVQLAMLLVGAGTAGYAAVHWLTPETAAPVTVASAAPQQIPSATSDPTFLGVSAIDQLISEGLRWQLRARESSPQTVRDLERR
jgi:hypothetical protein